MKETSFAGPRRRLFWLLATAALLSLALVIAGCSSTQSFDKSTYRLHPVAANLPGSAAGVDRTLIDPWGLTTGQAADLWVAENGSGSVQPYHGDGDPYPSAANPTIVKTPSAGGAPTAILSYSGNSLVISQGGASGPARVIIATQGGTIAAWNPSLKGGQAVTMVDQSGSSSFTGLALAEGASGPFLYAADFRAGRVAVFNSHFSPVTTPGGFQDSSIPAGYAPYTISLIDGSLYVIYARQNADKTDALPGAGDGFVDVYDLNGNFLNRLISRDHLNAPWGIVLASPDFGSFANMLLIGNHGDGRINAFDPHSGGFMGQLTYKENGQTIVIDGLRGISFGPPHIDGANPTLFFTSTPNGGQGGLIGAIDAED